MPHSSLSEASLVAQWWRICLPMQEMWVRPLGWEDPLEKEMATHSSILAWRIPWTEETGRPQFTGLQKSWVCSNQATTIAPFSRTALCEAVISSELCCWDVHCCGLHWSFRYGLPSASHLPGCLPRGSTWQARFVCFWTIKILFFLYLFTTAVSSLEELIWY